MGLISQQQKEGNDTMLQFTRGPLNGTHTHTLKNYKLHSDERMETKHCRTMETEP